jgi:hypothetical protein
VDQWPLLTAALATLVICSTLVGIGALLLSDGQHRALAAAITSVDGVEGTGSPDLVTTTTTVNRPKAGEPENTRALLTAAAATMTAAVGPYPATVSTWAASPMLYLPGTEPRLAYLLDADSASSHAQLVAGKWPGAVASGGPLEVAVPTTTAAALGLMVGSQIRLTVAPIHDESPAPDGTDLIVVGLVVPDGTSSWSRDVLQGAGVDEHWSRLPAYGPFLTLPGALVTADRAVERVSMVLDPDLAGDPNALGNVSSSIGGLGAAISGALGSRVGAVLVRSDLPTVISADRAELNLTGAIVLIVVLLVVALGVATLGLVGRLIVQRREPESELLAERGASRPQLVGRAAAESLALAALAVVLGIPLAIFGYRGLASVAPLGPAWRAASALAQPGITPPLVLAVAVGALFPAAVLVLVAMRNNHTRGRRRMPSSVARSGADLLLVAVAVLGYIQLRAHRIGSGSVDPILVVAPVLCIVAGAALALRAMPLVGRVAEFRARRSHGLVMPLVGWQISRGRATSGAFLMVLAAASATFGVTFLGTWTVSQQDQADASLGADLVVGEGGRPDAGSLLAAATGGTVVPVAARGISLGSRPGGAQLIALDTRQAGTVMRGRLPAGQSWSSLTAGLAPADPVAGLTVSGAAGMNVHLAITSTLAAPSLGASAQLDLTPTVVLEDAWGNREAFEGDPLVADGKSHDVVVPAAGQEPLPAGKWSVVAIDFGLGIAANGDFPQDFGALGSVKIVVNVPGADATPGTWSTQAVGQESALKPMSTAVDGTTVTSTIEGWIASLIWSDSHVVLVGFSPVNQTPVVVSDEVARQLNLAPDAPVTLVVGTTTVHGRVVRGAPYIPGAPRGAVVLADSDALSRALLAAGDLGSLTDAWWVANPRPGSAASAEAAGVHPVGTRASTAEQLRGGPLRVALRAALGLLVVAAVVLAVAGTSAHAAAVAQVRGTEFARLRGVGVGRRALLATGVVQHLAVTGATVLVGGLLGALLAWLIGPLLVVGEGGLRAVPGARVVWEWSPISAVLLAMLVAGFAVGVPAIRALVRRTTSVGLRMGDAS